jgi:hypothetical protein
MKSGDPASRMRSLSRLATGVSALDRLLDDLLDCYVGWREAAQEARVAYNLWCCSAGKDRALRFGTYVSALDREECAATAYAGIITQVTTRIADTRTAQD